MGCWDVMGTWVGGGEVWRGGLVARGEVERSWEVFDLQNEMRFPNRFWRISFCFLRMVWGFVFANGRFAERDALFTSFEVHFVLLLGGEA